MVSAGIIVDLLFRVWGLIPSGPRPPSAVAHEMIHWNYTSVLDLIAAVVSLAFIVTYLRTRGDSRPTHQH